MAVPTLTGVLPAVGPTSGGDLVRVTGTEFAVHVAIHVGGRPAVVVAVRDDAGVSLADVRTPAGEAGVVDIEVQNLDADGAPVDGEHATLTAAYGYVRPTIARESDLTRAVRQLLQELKRQVVANVSTTVSVDFDDTPDDGLNIIAMAKVPSVVLSGPRLRENRFYSTNVPHSDVVAGVSGVEVVRRKPPFTVDLVFTITAASNRIAELLNLMAAVATFLNRNRWLELVRDPNAPERGTARWEMDPDGEFRTQAGGKDDVRAFTCGLVVRGFDVEDGLPLDRGALVVEPELQVQSREGTA